MTVSLTSITWSILSIPILKSVSYCLIIFIWFDLELFVSPALILSARILSIRYLPVLEFWQTGSFQEGSWFCLSLLPLSPSTQPRGPNKALAVGSIWLCCRCSVFVEDITPSPGFHPPSPSSHLVWETWVLLPPRPLPAHHSQCQPPWRALCWCSTSHTQRWLSCLEPSIVSITSACLEQRGCVRVRFCGAFLMGNTPLYLEGRSMRRLDGSGRKETSLIILGGRDGISHSMCGKWGCRGSSEPPAWEGGCGLWNLVHPWVSLWPLPHQAVSPSPPGTPHLPWTCVLGLEQESWGYTDSPTDSSALEWRGVLQLMFLKVPRMSHALVNPMSVP